MQHPAETAAPITIRRSTIADVDALSEFLVPFVEVGRILPRTQHELEDLVEHAFVAVDCGRIVGFTALEVYSPKLAELRSLAVAPLYQGRGLGKRLVEACVELARELHVFEVMAITSADDFFRRCGFDFTLPGEKKALFVQTRERFAE